MLHAEALQNRTVFKSTQNRVSANDVSDNEFHIVASCPSIFVLNL